MLIYIKYLHDLKFPYNEETIKDRVALSDWLIGTAIRFEYGDNSMFNLIFVKLIKI